MSGPSPRFRIAPSPTGFFHVGGARTALLQLGAGPPARRHVRAADRGHRRGPQPPGVDAGHHRRPGLDRASAPTTRRSRARTSRAPTPRPTSPPPSASTPTAGRTTATSRASRSRPAPRQTGKPGYDGYSRDRGLGAGSRPGRCGSASPTATTVVHDAIRGDVTFANDTIEDFVLLRGNGTPDLRAGQRRRRHRDGHHPRRARRGAPAQHPQAAAAVGGARPRAAGRGRTCRCSSTSAARSCPSAATRSPSSSTATRATSPRPWSTT